MKKISILLALLVLFGGVNYQAFADNNGKSADVREDIEVKSDTDDSVSKDQKEVNDARLKEIEERMAALRRRLPIPNIQIGGKEEEGKSLTFIITNRFDWATKKLNNQFDRLTDLTTKLKADGKEVTDATTKLDSAKLLITKAETSVATLETFVKTVKNASENPSGKIIPVIAPADKAKIKELAKTAKEDIKAAHKALQEVVRTIAPLFGDDEDKDEDESETATTTTP